MKESEENSISGRDRMSKGNYRLKLFVYSSYNYFAHPVLTLYLANDFLSHMFTAFLSFPPPPPHISLQLVCKRNIWNIRERANHNWGYADDTNSSSNFVSFRVHPSRYSR